MSADNILASSPGETADPVLCNLYFNVAVGFSRSIGGFWELLWSTHLQVLYAVVIDKLLLCFVLLGQICPEEQRTLMES